MLSKELKEIILKNNFENDEFLKIKTYLNKIEKDWKLIKVL
jgi:hypothetical protein